MKRGEEHLRNFLKFHKENPHVYVYFEELCKTVLARGILECSAYLIYQRLRWHGTFETTGEPWKLCNNHQPYYARLFLIRNPEHSEFFKLHRLFSGRPGFDKEVDKTLRRLRK